jgi:hypothetical protein
MVKNKMTSSRSLIVFLSVACVIVSTEGGSFLSTWQENLLPVIGDRCLLDLSLPGTHDTLTYDLSERIAAGAIDGHPDLAVLLHDLSLLHLTPGKFIQSLAQTQTLNITAQLDNGIRFFDLRIMYTSKVWKSLHTLESRQLALTYLKQLRGWMDVHPKEIVVLWLSKHGNEHATGNDQYPGVTIKEKLAFWHEIESVFQGLLFDTTISSANTTTINTLLSRNHRVMIYASDYIEFTNSSAFAYNAALIENVGGPGAVDEAGAFAFNYKFFQNGATQRRNDAAKNGFLLLSMAMSTPAPVVPIVLELKVDPIHASRDKLLAKCAALFKIPNITAFCPITLLDLGRFNNYYSQLTMELPVRSEDFDFPHAIYLDAVDVDGVIVTGAETGKEGNDVGSDPIVQRYAYVDTLLLYNVQRACNTTTTNATAAECASMESTLQGRRSVYPLQAWYDNENGRVAGWPHA